MSRTQIVYFDDEKKDRERLADLLSATKVVSVVAKPPPHPGESFSGESETPDAFLVDYQLDKVEEAGQDSVHFRGGTLATLIREDVQDRPIMLVTKGSLEEWKHDEDVMEMLGVFDRVFLKGDLNEHPIESASVLADIADGFSRLRSENGRVSKNLREVLGVQTDREWELVRQAGPPLNRHGKWTVPRVARWIRGVLLEFPGVLLNDLHASVLLGVDFNQWPVVSEVLEESGTRYSGPFAAEQPRWWRNRLVDWVVDSSEGETSGPLSSVSRGVLESVIGTKLQPSLCNSCDRPADSVCYVLSEPTMLRCSARYEVDSRPDVMDEARVSFKALSEAEVVDELVELDAERIAEIRKKDR